MNNENNDENNEMIRDSPEVVNPSQNLCIACNGRGWRHVSSNEHNGNGDLDDGIKCFHCTDCPACKGYGIYPYPIEPVKPPKPLNFWEKCGYLGRPSSGCICTYFQFYCCNNKKRGCCCICLLGDGDGDEVMCYC